MATKKIRTFVMAGGGALLLTVLAIVGAVGLLRLRSGEQQRFMEARSVHCQRGSVEACDALRSACDKRSGEACVALADAYLAEGKRHDPREALRLLEAGCTHHHAEACSRGGRLCLAEPRDVPRARKLLSHGCEIGQKDDCALLATLPAVTPDP